MLERRLTLLSLLALAFCQAQQYPGQYQAGQFNRPVNQNGLYGAQQPGQNAFGQVQNPWNPLTPQQQAIQQQQQQQQRFGQQGLYPNGQNGLYGSQNGLGQQQNGLYGNSQLSGQQATSKPLLSQNINTPEKLAATSTNGAQIDIQITGYSNPSLSLSNGTTCACKSCDFLTSYPNKNACKFSFVTIISSSDQSVQFYSTSFVPFTGSLDASNAGNWSNPMSFQMPSKPVAIDVFVYHLGVVISATDETLLYFDRLSLVDSFVADIYSYDPTNTQNVQRESLNGKMTSTQLGISYSVRCINGKMGKNCNLDCGVSPNSTFVSVGTGASAITQPPPSNFAGFGNTVLCRDNNGVYSQCSYNSARTQAQNCITCTNGVTANGTCVGFQEPIEAGVWYGFRTWTIVLGSLLGLALILIICLILAYIIIRNKERQDKYEAASASAYPVARSTTASRPLLGDDEWSAPPTSRRMMPPPHVTGGDGEMSRASDESFRNGHAGGQQRQEHQV